MPLTGNIFQKQRRSSGILNAITGAICIYTMPQQARLKIKLQKAIGWLHKCCTLMKAREPFISSQEEKNQVILISLIYTKQGLMVRILYRLHLKPVITA